MHRRDLIKLGGVLPFASSDARGKDEVGNSQPARSTTAAAAAERARPVTLRVALDRSRGPLQMDRIALGQGGLSPEPMWADRVAEIRALRPRLIRVFLQEYFNLLPEPDEYPLRDARSHARCDSGGGRNAARQHQHQATRALPQP